MLVDYMDFFGSYDDIARRLQSEADKRDQEYVDNLKLALAPRKKSLGETFSQALLTFGAPLLGKAFGGNQLAAQGAKIGLEQSQALSAGLDAEHKQQQLLNVEMAKSAKQDADILRRQALEIPEKKLGVMGQIAVNDRQAENVFARQKEMAGIEHVNRMKEIGARNAGQASIVAEVGLPGQIAQFSEMYRGKMGKDPTPEIVQSWEATLRAPANKGGGPDAVRRLIQAQAEATVGYTNDAVVKPGGRPTLDNRRTKTKIMGTVPIALDAIQELKAAIQAGDLTAIRNASGSSIQAINSVATVGGFGQALTGPEINNFWLQLAPLVKNATTMDDFQRAMVSSGIDPLKSLDMTMNRLKRQADIVLSANEYMPAFTAQAQSMNIQDQLTQIREQRARNAQIIAQLQAQLGE